jgi:hypothetical protein
MIHIPTEALVRACLPFTSFVTAGHIVEKGSQNSFSSTLGKIAQLFPATLLFISPLADRIEYAFPNIHRFSAENSAMCILSGLLFLPAIFNRLQACAHKNEWHLLEKILSGSEKTLMTAVKIFNIASLAFFLAASFAIETPLLIPIAVAVHSLLLLSNLLAMAKDSFPREWLSNIHAALQSFLKEHRFSENLLENIARSFKTIVDTLSLSICAFSFGDYLLNLKIFPPWHPLFQLFLFLELGLFISYACIRAVELMKTDPVR